MKEDCVGFVCALFNALCSIYALCFLCVFHSTWLMRTDMTVACGCLVYFFPATHKQGPKHPLLPATEATAGYGTLWATALCILPDPCISTLSREQCTAGGGTLHCTGQRVQFPLHGLFAPFFHHLNSWGNTVHAACQALHVHVREQHLSRGVRLHLSWKVSVPTSGARPLLEHSLSGVKG